MTPTNHQTTSLGRRADIIYASSLIAVTFVTRLLFLYRNGMADPDSMVMAAGMAVNLNSDAAFGDTVLYGRQVNPGMYFVTRAIYPLLFSSPANVVGFLNWFNLIASSLLVWPVYAVFRRSLSPAVAAGAILLFVFSPLAWEAGTYFHPVVPAVLLLFVAIFAWERIAGTARGVFFFLLAYTAGTAAVIMRASVFFVLPALLLWSCLSHRRNRNLVVLSTLVILAAGTYFVVVETMSRIATREVSGLADYISGFVTTYYRAFLGLHIFKFATWAILSIGVATCFLCAYELTKMVKSRTKTGSSKRRGDGRLLYVAAAWVLVPLLFWLPLPVPIMRHYLLPAIGVSWFAGYAILSNKTALRVFAITAITVALNLSVPEIAYRTYNTLHSASVKEPHGTFFYHHQRTAARIARYNRMQDDVLRVVHENAGGEVSKPAPGVIIEASWEGYAYFLYAIASSPYPLTKLSETRDREHVHFHRYLADGVEMRLITCLPGDVDGRGEVNKRIDEAMAEGFLVFVPAESVGVPRDTMRSGVEIRVY